MRKNISAATIYSTVYKKLIPKELFTRRNIEHRIIVNADYYRELEQACFDKMTSQLDYNNCLTRPNIAYIGLSPSRFGDRFKWFRLTLSKIEVTVDLKLFGDDGKFYHELTGSSVFLSTATPLSTSYGYHLEASKAGEHHAAERDKTVPSVSWA
uniref:SAC domain-containing protein n=1 Tax=Steinernema glaseri TaxID=37863 RepID=A0A1I7Y8L0_9BILA